MVYKKPIVFIFILALLFSLGTFNSKAAFDCLTLSTASAQADKDYCRSELANIEKQLEDLIKKQGEQKKNTGSLTGDVNLLNSQIKTLQTKVKARALAIASLKVSINEKSSKIATLEEKIDSQHASIAQLLRNTNDFDNENLVHLLLSDKSLFAFYSDLESYSSIKEAVKFSVDQIKGVKTETQAEKNRLEQERNAETDAKASLESTQKKVAEAEAEKKRLLSISKNKEVEYKKLASEKKVQADKIRSALFNLAGISTKIEFGTALQYANDVSAKTGVEPAFLLAILTQESNLGSNVGQCYLTNAETGEGVGKNTGKIFVNTMKPSRDVAPFLEITNKLGFNAFKTAVSCPIAGVAGWGGAMGPAQFIPSTWKIFEGRLENALGHYANPWAPRDAFMASGMYLTDLGAVGDSVSAQNKAACRYYGSGGASCSYSKSVQNLKNKIQGNIDLLAS
ncbi:MAG: lytic murein transglycosylase [bacterium]|nr:lytic murein transglycosylase [bacterium]